MSVSSYISKDLKLINSYDTWHGKYPFCILYLPHHLCLKQNVGTKNVKKEIKKITKGTKANRGVVWFPELVDKGM